MDGGVHSRGTTFLRACPTTLVTGSPASGARVRSPVLVRPRSVRRSRLWHMREPLALLRARPPFRVLPYLSPPAAAGLTLTTLTCSSHRRRPLKDRSSRTSHHRPSTPPSATAPFTLPLALLIASPTPSSSSSPSEGPPARAGPPKPVASMPPAAAALAVPATSPLPAPAQSGSSDKKPKVPLGTHLVAGGIAGALRAASDAVAAAAAARFTCPTSRPASLTCRNASSFRP